MQEFVKEFHKGKIFVGLKRIVVKEFPKTAENALAAAGFHREMQDFVLYRK